MCSDGKPKPTNCSQKQPPCLNCQLRKVGCHAECERYKEFADWRKSALEKQRGAKAVEVRLLEHDIDRVYKIKRRRKIR